MNETEKTEARIQHECFMWHWNTFPEERLRLFLIYNNPRNAIDGARLKGQGMIAGVGDMEYLRPYSTPIFIEFKTKTGRQSKKQVEFEEACKAIGVGYEICRSMEDFKRIIGKE